MKNNKKIQKYATGVRFLKSFNVMKNEEMDRVDVLLLRVLKEEPKYITVVPDTQFNFSFNPESITPKQIAHCLRSLAYKIQHNITKK